MAPDGVAAHFYPGPVPSSPPSRRLGRRALLGLGAGLAVTSVTGCTVGGGSGTDPGSDPPFGRERAACVPRSSLEAHTTLAGAPLVYEPTDRATRFWFDPGFYTALDAWAASLAGDSRVQRWSTYGSWTDGGSQCDSWHNSGRGFDLARVRLADGTAVSCRYDQWGSARAAELTRSRRAYWSLAAGLHQRFAYVLTYLYDAAHANHIHVDNGRSGADVSELSTRSRVQVQAVQAICTYLWDEPVELTGRWDAATRRASQRVLETVGSSGSLDDGAVQWQAFLTASASAD